MSCVTKGICTQDFTALVRVENINDFYQWMNLNYSTEIESLLDGQRFHTKHHHAGMVITDVNGRVSEFLKLKN